MIRDVMLIAEWSSKGRRRDLKWSLIPLKRISQTSAMAEPPIGK